MYTYVTFLLVNFNILNCYIRLCFYLSCGNLFEVSRFIVVEDLTRLFLSETILKSKYFRSAFYYSRFSSEELQVIKKFES